MFTVPAPFLPVASAPTRPVILVPGFSGQNVVYWNVLRRMLEGAGHPTFSISFPRAGLGDIRASAADLSGRVDEVRAVTGAPRVDLVGHSIGGLVVRYYVEHLGGADRVANAVTLATPHHGTHAGWLVYFMPAGRQILPGSAFLRALDRDGVVAAMRARGVRFHNLYSATDPLLLPNRNGRLEGAENRRLLLGGHLGLLVSPRVFHIVREALDAPPGREGQG